MAAEDVGETLVDEPRDHVPPDFICPITQEIMRFPVIALDGHSYERDAIVKWFQRGQIKSPLTNAPLGSRHVAENHTLRKGQCGFYQLPHHRPD